MGLNFAPESTGIGPYTSQMAVELAERGYDVTVLTGVPHYPQWKRWTGWQSVDGFEQIDNLKVVRFWHPVPREGRLAARVVMETVFGVRSVLYLARHRLRGGNTVVVSPAMISSLLVLSFLKRGRNPSCSIAWIQDVYSNAATEVRSSHGLVSKSVETLESRMLSAAKYVLVIDDRFKEVVQRLGATHERTRTMKNWGHLGIAEPNRIRHFREVLVGSRARRIVLHTGNMGKKQSLDVVVEAARLADLRSSPIQFVLTGDGSERRRLASMSEGIDRITIMDPVDTADYPSLLQAADLLLLNEASGMMETALPSKLTAYFSAGKPIIGATESGSITHDTLTLSGAAKVVSPGSALELIEASLSLLADSVMQESLGDAGIQFAKTLSGVVDAANIIEKCVHDFDALASVSLSMEENR
ncbi:glycosyltransferase involved in cell wall biosynthesis [Rhodococcus sp. PvP016]|nr:glycosyltransferase involved in cell wall biosynthesis [Rhodococcus sp. PvP016]